MSEVTYPLADRRSQWFENRYPGVVSRPQVVVLHTTEGRTWNDYQDGAVAPTLTVMPLPQTRRLIWRQHYSVNRAARALRATAEGPTNNRGAIQVEMVGTCSKTGPGYYWPKANEWALQGIADFLAWVNQEWSVPLVAAKGWPDYPSSPAIDRATRLSMKSWLAFRGVCGHLHVPGNTHLDPGAFPIETVLGLARAKAVQEDDMPLTDAEIAKIASAVWGAQFGGSAAGARETAGQRLAQAASQQDLAALEARLTAAMKGS